MNNKLNNNFKLIKVKCIYHEKNSIENDSCENLILRDDNFFNYSISSRIKLDNQINKEGTLYIDKKLNIPIAYTSSDGSKVLTKTALESNSTDLIYKIFSFTPFISFLIIEESLDSIKQKNKNSHYRDSNFSNNLKKIIAISIFNIIIQAFLIYIFVENGGFLSIISGIIFNLINFILYKKYKNFKKIKKILGDYE